jgi:hypothetical protein
MSGSGSMASFPLTVTFSLTGGTDSVPAASDLVVVTLDLAYSGASISGIIQNASAVDYTLGAEAYGTDAGDCTCRVGYRFMPATPETTCVLDVASGSGTYAYTIHVYRNVDQSTPMDVTAVTANGNNTHLANPGAITPVTPGAWVHVGGAASCTAPGSVYTTTDLTNFISTLYGTGSYKSKVGAGYYPSWTSGAFDPAVFTGGGTDNTDNSWAAVTLALRPALSSVSLFFGSNF